MDEEDNIEGGIIGKDNNQNNKGSSFTERIETIDFEENPSINEYEFKTHANFLRGIQCSQKE